MKKKVSLRENRKRLSKILFISLLFMLTFSLNAEDVIVKEEAPVGEKSALETSESKTMKDTKPFIYLSKKKKFALLPLDDRECDWDGTLAINGTFFGKKKKVKAKVSKKEREKALDSEAEVQKDTRQSVDTDKSFTLQAIFQMNEREVYLSLSNEFGVDMCELVFNGTEVKFTSSMFPANFKGEYIVFDFQLAFFDSTALKNALRPLKIDFIDYKKDGVEFRILMNKDKCIERVTKEGDKITVENYAWHYKYILETLEGGVLRRPAKSETSDNTPASTESSLNTNSSSKTETTVTESGTPNADESKESTSSSLNTDSTSQTSESEN